MISRGTERLVYEGRLPASEWVRMRAPAQEGDFPFPVKYGYSAVGIVVNGPPGVRGRAGFALHPHQDRFVVAADAVCLLPEGLPPRRAALAANMETALNALWDAAVAPADRVVVIGGGMVGLLVAFLAARLPGAEVTLVDVVAERGEVARALGVGFATPDTAPREADIVFHASATEEGLGLALACAGAEATVVEMSWYGDREVTLRIGGNFHSRRLRIISSQVGMVALSHRPRWSRKRRLGAALALLRDDCLDEVPLEEVAFEALPAALPRLLATDAPGLGAIISYPD